MIDSIDFGKGKITHGTLPKLGVSFEEQSHILSEDILTVLYQEGKYVIDVGHYGDQELSVTVSIDGNVRKEPFKEIAYNPEDLKSAIERAVRKVHELLDQPDEVSPYTNVLSPRYSTDPVDSLLGRIEVEWEIKESEVTEEMVETVKKGGEFRYQLN